MAMIMSDRVVRRQMYSALPDAPVVAPVLSRPPMAWARTVLARVLNRAAQAVAPASPTVCDPAR